MSELLLRPGPNEYEVITEGQVVTSRCSALRRRHALDVSIDFEFHEGRHPAHGFEVSREAAMQAFAASWFRDRR
jgi:hypothetical protein